MSVKKIPSPLASLAISKKLSDNMHQKSKDFATGYNAYRQALDDKNHTLALRLLLSIASLYQEEQTLIADIRHLLWELEDIEQFKVLKEELDTQYENLGVWLFCLGEHALLKNDNVQATYYLNRALAAGEYHADLFICLATIDVASKNLKQAEERLMTALELAADRVCEIYSTWGKLLLEHDFDEQAQDKLRIAIVSQPDHFYPYACLGCYYAKQNQAAHARHYFELALQRTAHDHLSYTVWILEEWIKIANQDIESMACMEFLLRYIRQGYYSLFLLEQLRQLKALQIAPWAKRYVLKVAHPSSHEQGHLVVYEFIVDANDELSAYDFAQHTLPSDVYDSLLLLDTRIEGKAQSTYAGVVDIRQNRTL